MQKLAVDTEDAPLDAIRSGWGCKGAVAAKIASCASSVLLIEWCVGYNGRALWNVFKGNSGVAAHAISLAS